MHLQAFDESLANLQVDLTAPIVVSTPAETRQRLNGLDSLIRETLPLVQKGFTGVSPGQMVQQAKRIDQNLAAAAKAQGTGLLRILALIKTAEESLEGAVRKAVPAAPAGTPENGAQPGGAPTGNAQIVVKAGGSSTPLAPGAPVLFPERTSLSSFATAGERVQALQLINVGSAQATVTTVAVQGPDARDFIVSPGCDNATLAAGSTQEATAASACFVSVEVRAARYSRPLKASLLITGSGIGSLPPVPLALTEADLTLGSLLASSGSGQLTYRFGVRNVGPDPAERTEVDAKVTATTGSLRLVSSLPEGCTYGSGTGILACALGTLPAHAQTTLTVVFQAPKAGIRVTNQAAVQSLDFDPTPRNDLKTIVTALK